MNAELLWPELTQRQYHILKAVAHGYTNEYIGNMEGISERTVEYHVSNLIQLLLDGQQPQLNERVKLATTYFRRILLTANEMARG